ncbi:RraA family protein [Kitasatospora sp. NPDC006697]|uniref:RraA family protein n=1 Tax=Kitasatospora sp. NPDC006697 TaxID=3364020 RepID=UPI0036C9B135
METIKGFAELSPTTLADVVGAAQVMDLGIRPVYAPMMRLAGPAFTVSCPAGDNLMLHAAIHRAEPGSVVVVSSGGDLRYALAGGNVCAVAQRRGIAGFVLDGVLRDLAEIRAMGFPVLARGVVPVPGGKAAARPLGEPVVCGGVTVRQGDLVVGDEEGVVVTPRERAAEVLAAAKARLAEEAAQTLDAWQAEHRARIDVLLAEAGFTG